MVNIKLVKQILLILEDKPENLNTAEQLQNKNLKYYSVDDVRKATKFLIDEELIKGKVIYADGTIYTITIGSLTSTGMNYITRLKDKRVWKKVDKLSKEQTITFQRLIEITIVINEKRTIKIANNFIIPILITVISGLIVYFLTNFFISLTPLKFTL